jgi:phage terminase small subunit
MASAKKQDNQYKLFAQEYIKDLNATRAAIAAGYSEKTATMQGSRLLTHDKVKQLIQENMSKREERTEITADNVLKDIHIAREIALGIKPHKMIIKDNIGDGMTEHVEQELHKTDLTAFVKLTELQMKHLGMFIEKQEVTHMGHITMLPHKDEDN